MTTTEDSSTPLAAPAPSGGAPGGPGAVNPAALTAAQLGRMLGISVEKVREHIAAGAPTGPDGTINLVHYAAWLNRELAKSNGNGEATS